MSPQISPQVTGDTTLRRVIPLSGPTVIVPSVSSGGPSGRLLEVSGDLGHVPRATCGLRCGAANPWKARTGDDDRTGGAATLRPCSVSRPCAVVINELPVEPSRRIADRLLDEVL